MFFKLTTLRTPLRRDVFVNIDSILFIEDIPLSGVDRMVIHFSGTTLAVEESSEDFLKQISTQPPPIIS